MKEAAKLATVAVAVALTGLVAGCDEGPWDPSVAEEPFPRLDADAYVCPEDQVGVCWGLEERDAMVARYEGVTVEPESGPECRLVGAPDGIPDEIFCGRVLLGVLAGRTRHDYVEASVRAGGEITTFREGAYAVLEVSVGEEVQALRRVIYDPSLRYVELERADATLDIR